MNKDRNYGIDALRIFAMYMVVTIHVLGCGGILVESDKRDPFCGYIMRLCMIACCGAVNCYALISGYVGYKTKFKISTIVYLWFQVVFYTIIITAIFAMCGTDVSWLAAIFPVMFRTYWYFTAFFALFFLKPFLNWILEFMPRERMKKLLLVLFLLFSLLPSIRQMDIFYTSNGYSALWLSILYLYGGYMKKYQISRMNIRKSLIVYLIMILVTFGLFWVSENILEKVISSIDFKIVEYTFPTVFLGAIALVNAFAQIQCSERWIKVIKLLAPVSFGVYLIHTHPLIYYEILPDRFSWIADLGIFAMLGMIVAVTIGIFVVCAVIDAVRLQLFRLLKIDKLSKLVGEKLENIGNKIVQLL